MGEGLPSSSLTELYRVPTGDVGGQPKPSLIFHTDPNTKPVISAYLQLLFQPPNRVLPYAHWGRRRSTKTNPSLASFHTDPYTKPVIRACVLLFYECTSKICFDAYIR